MCDIAPQRYIGERTDLSLELAFNKTAGESYIDPSTLYSFTLVTAMWAHPWFVPLRILIHIFLKLKDCRGFLWAIKNDQLGHNFTTFPSGTAAAAWYAHVRTQFYLNGTGIENAQKNSLF